MGDNKQGLHDQFRVERTDGRDRPGGDREGAAYFVLDLTHDPHAVAAAVFYAYSVGNQQLADDLLTAQRDQEVRNRVQELIEENRDILDRLAER